jgi:hypothetical protein
MQQTVGERRGTSIVLLAATALGLGIGYVDSRPTWDDTGISAAAILLTAAILAAVRPRAAWWVGTIVGVAVLGWSVATGGGFGAAVALPIALIGAAAGRMVGGSPALHTPGAP